jgi:hypothetical protein
MSVYNIDSYYMKFTVSKLYMMALTRYICDSMTENVISSAVKRPLVGKISNILVALKDYLSYSSDKAEPWRPAEKSSDGQPCRSAFTMYLLLLVGAEEIGSESCVRLQTVQPVLGRSCTRAAG